MSEQHLIVFDFDGTLADTWRDIAAALNTTLEEEGIAEVGGPAIRHAIGEGVLPLLEKVAPELASDPGRLDALYTRFRDHYDRCCLATTALYEGMEECLDRLGRFELAVVSNKPTRFLEPMLREMGIAERFSAIIAGDTLTVRKPDPDVWNHLLELLRPPYGQSFMVGDSAVDIETGRGAGAITIGCAWGLRGEAELRGAGAHHMVQHPMEIADLVLDTGS